MSQEFFKPLLYLVNGKAVADASRLKVLPFSLLPNQPNNSQTLSAGRAGAVLLATVANDGPLVIESLAASQSLANGALVMIEVVDANDSRLPLMNNSCLLSTIFGSGSQPYPLPEALRLDAGSALAISLANTSASTADVVNLLLGGYKLLHTSQKTQNALSAARRVSTPFWYTLAGGKSSIVVATSTTNTEYVTIANNHDFELHQISAVSTGAFDINLVDQSTGRSVIGAPSGAHYAINKELICGTGNFPFRFPEPILIGAGQKLVVTLTDTTGSNNDVYLSLGGRAFWK